MRKLRHRHSLLHAFADPCGSVAARRIPADCRAKLSVSNPSLLQQRVAERRNSRARNAAPVGPSYDRTCPSSGRELPAHNADRRAFRRSTAAFSFVLGTAFWKRTGAPIRNALDSTGFPPLSSAPPARCRTDPCSWAGRCLPRPPEARLTRPNPQAPPLLRQQASPVDALCRAGMRMIKSTSQRTYQEQPCGYRPVKLKSQLRQMSLNCAATICSYASGRSSRPLAMANVFKPSTASAVIVAS